MREEVVALEDHADPGALPGELAAAQADATPAGAVAERLAVEPDLAAVEFLEEVDAAEQRGLAGTAGADDRNDVGGKHIEVDAAEDRLRPEGLLQALDGEDRVHAPAPNAAGSGVRATSRRRRW